VAVTVELPAHYILISTILGQQLLPCPVQNKEYCIVYTCSCNANGSIRLALIMIIHSAMGPYTLMAMTYITYMYEEYTVYTLYSALDYDHFQSRTTTTGHTLHACSWAISLQEHQRQQG